MGRLEVYLHLVSERHEKAHRAEFSLKFRILILELYRFELTVYPNYLKTDHQLVNIIRKIQLKIPDEKQKLNFVRIVQMSNMPRSKR